jgi:iron complex transport system ATP-binding protein
MSIVLTDRVNAGQLSVFTLVAFGRYPYTDWTGRLSQNDIKVIHWAIDAVGAEKLIHRNVSELSDGERQKVMIARALAQQPHAIILDEPTAFLDLPRRVEMMSLLRQLARQTGAAILLSTHDLELSLRTADRLWLIAEAEPIKVGAPEDLVLSGTLAHAFQSDGIEFDKHHGTFVLTHDQKEHVRLHGNGFHGLWTQKALEREGFAVNTPHEESSIHIYLKDRNGTPAWELQIQNKSTHHATIYELMLTLRKRRKEME